MILFLLLRIYLTVPICSNYIDVIGNVKGDSRLQINPHIIQPSFDNFPPFYGFFSPPPFTALLGKP